MMRGAKAVFIPRVSDAVLAPATSLTTPDPVNTPTKPARATYVFTPPSGALIGVLRCW